MSGIAFAFVIVLLVITFVFASTTYNQISQDYLEDNNTLMNTYDEYQTDDNYDNDNSYNENYYDSDNTESYNEKIIITKTKIMGITIVVMKTMRIMRITKITKKITLN